MNWWKVIAIALIVLNLCLLLLKGCGNSQLYSFYRK